MQSVKSLFLGMPLLRRDSHQCCNFALVKHDVEMYKTRFFFSALGLLACSANMLAQDSTAQQRLTGYVMTEMNYGHRHGQEHPTLTDFPHILANATLTLGKGWSAVA